MFSSLNQVRHYLRFGLLGSITLLAISAVSCSGEGKVTLLNDTFFSPLQYEIVPVTSDEPAASGTLAGDQRVTRTIKEGTYRIIFRYEGQTQDFCSEDTVQVTGGSGCSTGPEQMMTPVLGECAGGHGGHGL
jgi:hypothetical protein